MSVASEHASEAFVNFIARLLRSSLSLAGCGTPSG